jgi:hypothetical protein
MCQRQLELFSDESSINSSSSDRCTQCRLKAAAAAVQRTDGANSAFVPACRADKTIAELELEDPERWDGLS